MTFTWATLISLHFYITGAVTGKGNQLNFFYIITFVGDFGACVCRLVAGRFKQTICSRHKLCITLEKRKKHIAKRFNSDHLGWVNREVKHHVYVKRQTRICTTWPSFSFTCRLLFIISTHKLVVSPIRIVLSCFYLSFSILRYSQLDSDVCRIRDAWTP